MGMQVHLTAPSLFRVSAVKMSDFDVEIRTINLLSPQQT
jgi:hypothetical protein